MQYPYKEAASERGRPGPRAQVIEIFAVLTLPFALASTLVQFDNWFEILPGTKKDRKALPAKPELFDDDGPAADNTD